MAMFDFFKKLKFGDDSSEYDESLNRIASDRDDGAIEIPFDAISQFAMNLDWSYNNQAELINMYRDTANYNLVDFAIEDIMGEMISFDEDEEPVELDLSDIEDKELSENIKNKIYESWGKLTTTLELKGTIARRAKNFYVDGRLAYQKVIDTKKPTEGIKDIIELDTRAVTKYRGIKYDETNAVITGVDEYFIYDESVLKRDGKGKNTDKANQFKTALKLDPKMLVYVTSGLTDTKTGFTISWLHKAVKPANQLRMMENALVIYRITRAPERRIFYVDTANLPKSKAQQYITNLKNNYRNKMSFDPESGSFKDQRHLQTMQEDYWLPRNSNGRGTEVSTLPGGQNLSDIDDVLYFQKQLYKALNIPVSRLESDSMMALGRTSEINRDELKFSKFVSKIRKRFNLMFLDLLKTELVLTKVIDAKEWAKIEQKIKFKYALDMYLEELKQTEMVRDRLDLLRDMKDDVGKYFSHKYVRQYVLKQTEQDVEDIDKEIEEERDNEQYYPKDPDQDR